MAKIGVNVLIDDQHKSRMTEVEERLKAAGMVVERRLDALGVITGACDSTRQQELQRIPGVAQVRQDRAYQIAPPEAEIQ